MRVPAMRNCETNKMTRDDTEFSVCIFNNFTTLRHQGRIKLMSTHLLLFLLVCFYELPEVYFAGVGCKV